MADNEIGNLRVRLGLDGASFQEGMRSITNELRNLSGQLTEEATRVDGFGNSLAGLQSRSTNLSRQLELQNERLRILREEYTRAVTTHGQYSQEAQTLANRINGTSTAINRLGTQLSQVNSQIAAQINSWNQLSSSLQNLQSRLSTIGDGLKNVGQSLTMGLTLPIAALGVKAFELASDMNETMNKIDVAFKSNANEVKAWSETTLTKFGIAKGTALDMAALFGDMGTGMGLTTSEASKMATSMVGLAGDLASFKNVRIDVAQTALKGIFTGEGESLKGLGIIMLDSTLKSYALSKGITTKYEAMTQAEKVALRYSFVMESAKNSIGDFANTSQGTANQIRIFQESLKQLGEQFGQQLIPVITPFIQKLNEMLSGFAKLSPEAQKTTVIIAAIAAAIGPVLVVLGTLISSVGTIAGVFATASTAISTAGGILAVLTGPVGIAAAAIAGLIAAGVLLYENWDVVKAKCIEMAETLKPTWDMIKSTVNNAIQSIGDFMKPQLDKYKDFWDENGQEITAIIKIGWEVIKSLYDLYFRNMIEAFKIAWNTISVVVSTVWQVIKGVMSVEIDLILGIVQTGLKLLKGDWSGAWETIKQTAMKILVDIVNTFKSMDLFQAGKDIIQGLINGINNMIGNSTTAAINLAKNISGSIKDVLRINSPSKVTQEHGNSVGEGLIDGMKEKENGVKSAAKSLADQIKTTFDASVRWIDDRKYYNELSLSEELAAWQRVQQRYTEGTEERRKADREVYRVKKQINDDEAKIEQDRINQLAKLKKDFDAENIKITKDSDAERLRLDNEYKTNYMNVAKESDDKLLKISQEYETNKTKLIKESESERLNLEKKYNADSEKLMNDANEKIKQYNDEYIKQLEAKEKSLYSFMDIFSAVDKTQNVSGEVLLTNLQDQVNAFDDWQKNIKDLVSKGLDDGLVKELQEMGPKSGQQIDALTSLSDVQLQKYAELWRTKHKQAKDESIAELSNLKTETDIKINDITSSTQLKLADLKTVYEKNSEAINNDTNDKLVTLKNIYDESNFEIKTDTAFTLEGLRLNHEQANEQINVQTALKLAALESNYSSEMLTIKTNTGTKLSEMADNAKITSDNLMTNLIDGVKNRQGDFEQVNEDTNTGVKTKLDALYVIYSNSFETLNVYILSKFTQMAFDIKNLGINMMDGLINGINSKQSEVMRLCSNIANSVAMTMRNALQIKSPSKVMMEIGAYTTDGLIQGIISKQGLLIDTAKGLSNNISSNAAGTSNISNNNSNRTINVNITQNISDRKTADYANDSIIKIFQGRGLGDSFI